MSDFLKAKFSKVEEIYKEEKAQQKPALNKGDIPFSYELITDEWLTAILCENVADAKVVAHSLDEPDEGTSNRRRVFVEYNEAGNNAGLPKSIFCKGTQSLESRYILGINDCVHGETTFYNKVRPLLDIEVPEAYFAQIDMQSLNSITVLKDMAGSVEFCDEDTVIDLDRVKGQLALLAKFHGRFYNAPELDGVLQDYLTFEDFSRLTEEGATWSDSCYRGVLAAKDVIPESLYKRADEVWAYTELAFNRHSELPRTLIHNDVHLKNWYITADQKMGLSDWQCSVRGHWSRDLAYMLSTSLTVENRRAWEKDLIQFYLEKLSDEGVDTGSFEQVFLLYRQQLFSALIMWTATIAPSAGAPEMQPQKTSLEFIKRIGCAIDDLNAFDSFS